MQRQINQLVRMEVAVQHSLCLIHATSNTNHEAQKLYSVAGTIRSMHTYLYKKNLLLDAGSILGSTAICVADRRHRHIQMTPKPTCVKDFITMRKLKLCFSKVSTMHLINLVTLYTNGSVVVINLICFRLSYRPAVQQT